MTRKITPQTKLQVQCSMARINRHVFPCIRLVRGKFELTNQDSAGGNIAKVKHLVSPSF